MVSKAVVEYAKEGEFQSLLIDNPLLVVDFTASWCGPCKVVSPLMDRLAESYEGRAKVVKLDVDSNGKIAKKYGIKSIPAVLFFKDGELQKTVTGVSPYEQFSEALESLAI